MHPRRIVPVLAAILVSTSMLLSGAGPGSVSGAQAAVTCSTGQRQAFVSFHARINWQTYGEVYFGGGSPSIVNKHTIHSGPVGTAVFTFCVAKASNGTWSIKKVVTVVGGDYYNVSSNLTTSGTGFLLRPTKVTATTVQYQPVVCRYRDPIGTLVQVLNLPIPGIHYTVALGALIVGALVPSSTVCQAFSTKTLTVHFLSNGDAYADDYSATFSDKVPETAQCTGTQCFFVQQWAWSVVSP
jgi:hypothetical protein